MGAVISDSWANAVAYELGPNVTIQSDIGGFKVLLPCTSCPKTAEYHIAKKLPPVVIRRNLIGKGWRTGKHLACESCMRSRPASTGRTPITDARPVAELMRPQPKITPAPQPAPQPAAPQPTVVAKEPAVTPVTQPAPAKVASMAELGKLVEPTKDQQLSHRRVMKLLEEVFDDLRLRYVDDSSGQPYSDQRVADEAGSTVEHVRVQREHYFGKLRAPEDLEELEKKLSDTNEQIQSLKTEAEAAVQRAVEQLQREMRAGVALLEKQAAAITEEFAKARARNNWKT